MIGFYVATGQYGYLSNFSAHGFLLSQKYWPSVEHYFQAQKFCGTDYEEIIRTARNPKAAKALGQSRQQKLRSDWEDVKVDIMKQALAVKFTTHADLRDALLATGDEELVETSPIDYFWGSGQLGGGQNMLGRLLMELRSSFRVKSASISD